MTKYSKCKHETDGTIILNEDLLSISAYFWWAGSVGVFGTKEICWDCWNDEVAKGLYKSKEKK